MPDVVLMAPPSAGQRAHVPRVVPASRAFASNSDGVVVEPGIDGRNLPPTGEGSTTLAFSFPAGVMLHVHCARTWLGSLLANVWGGDDAGRVELAAYEVIANAGVHGAGVVRLAVLVNTDELVMDVADDSPAMPKRRSASDAAENGRGLALVELLGGELAAWPLGSGKLVRLRIARETSAATLAAGWGLGDDDV